MGYSEKTEKIQEDYRYFVRTNEKGASLGDTSDMNGGFRDDFIYDFDETFFNYGSE